jgi:hypothetical protein
MSYRFHPARHRVRFSALNHTGAWIFRPAAQKSSEYPLGQCAETGYAEALGTATLAKGQRQVNRHSARRVLTTAAQIFFI